MNAQLISELTVFALAIFVGFEVISKVPTMLHTPLMSGTNAIHGIVIVGALLVAGADESTFATALGLVAVAFGAINVVGGFLVTDRTPADVQATRGLTCSRAEAIQLVDLLCIIAFIVGSKRLSNPATARSGKRSQRSACWAAIVATLVDRRIVEPTARSAVAMVIGAAIGAVSARSV